MKKKNFFLLLGFSFCFLFTPFSKNINTPIRTSAISETLSITSDEFISSWRKLREKYPNLCDVSKEDFEIIYSQYISLNEIDLEIVNETIDKDNYTIFHSIKFLIDKYRDIDNKGELLNQNNTLIIVISLAIFGMSTICGFFFLKNQNVID